MKLVFADTSLYVALMVAHDSVHQRALTLTETLQSNVVTTELVFFELAAYFAKPPYRSQLTQVIQRLRTSSSTEVIRPDDALIDRAWQLYHSHYDKSWSLADCLAFTVMRDRGISDALTTDHHFRQAGFNALLADA